MTPAIRRAHLADVPRIVEMVGHFMAAKVGDTIYGQVLTFKPKIVEELATLVITKGIIFLAVVDEQVVGMLAGVPLQDMIARTPMFDEMVWWVEPAHRRGSVGPRLLKAAEKWARQKGLRLFKMVAPAGSGVGDFYKKLGYEEVEASYVKRLT
jgi:GNAT superfamily N-acetyltransferase